MKSASYEKKKEQVGEGGAQCVPVGMPTMLKQTSIKHIKYVVNQRLELFYDNSFRELFG